MSARGRVNASAVVASILLAACAGRPAERIVGTPADALTPRTTVSNDTAPKEELRLVPPEVYMRTYLQLFGGLAPLEAQKKARSGDGNTLFDTWDDYVSALGFPDYRTDVPRQTMTNALMVATFERLGVALCDRAVLRDLAELSPKPQPALSMKERLIFAFEPPKGAVDAAAFAGPFDVLHRTFLGYPSSLAPPERAPRFLALYLEIARGHKAALPKSKLSPDQAAWAAVCYGLVRHPEFHLY